MKESHLGMYGPFDVSQAAQINEALVELKKVTLPYEPEEIKKLSEDLQVYIFNAGPLRFNQSMGSYGVRVIEGVPEGDVFSVGMSVSAPLIIPGLPSECYPNPVGGEMRRMYHRPLKRGVSPGMDFALNVMDAGFMSNPGSSLARYGVFISSSSIPDASEVQSAKSALRKTSEETYAYACMDFNRDGTMVPRYSAVAILSRVIGKTDEECPWLMPIPTRK